MEENKTKLELYFNGNFIYKVNKKNVEKVFNIMKESFMDTTIRGNVVRTFYDRDIGKVKHLIERESYVDIEMNMEGMMEYIKGKCIKIERLKDILIYIYIIIIFKKSEGYTYKYLQELYIYLERRMECGITLKQIKEYNEKEGEYYNVIKIEDGAEYIWKGSGEIDRYEYEEYEDEKKNISEGEIKKRNDEIEKKKNDIVDTIKNELEKIKKEIKNKNDMMRMKYNNDINNVKGEIEQMKRKIKDIVVNIEESNRKMEEKIKNQREESDTISIMLIEKIEELKNVENGIKNEEFNRMVIRILTEILIIKEKIYEQEKINEMEYDTLSNMSL
jgi:hypothetical protein